MGTLMDMAALTGDLEEDNEICERLWGSIASCLSRLYGGGFKYLVML